MRSFELTVTDPQGLHARPAGLLAKKATEYSGSVVLVSKANRRADAKKLFSVMSLAIKQKERIRVEVEGANEDAACLALRDFLLEAMVCKEAEDGI